MVNCLQWQPLLTHWGWVTHICVGKLTIIGSDNGLSPGQCQAIIWTNAGILLIRPLGTNFSQILIGIQTFSFKKMHLKMSSAKWHPFCLGLNVLMNRLWNEIQWHRSIEWIQGLRCNKWKFNPCCAEFMSWEITYLYFLSFLHTDMTHEIELPQLKKWSVY